MNSDNIELMKAAMANPNIASVDRLLANMETNHPFSVEEVSKQLNNPDSLLSKYFNSMIISSAIADAEIQKALLIQQIAEQQAKLQEEQALAEENQQARTKSIPGRVETTVQMLEYDLELLEKGINLIDNKLKELARLIKIFGNNSIDLEKARLSIERKYHLINENRRVLLEESLRPTLTLTQRAELEDFSSRYEQHLERSSPDNLRSHLPSTIDPDSPDIALQMTYRGEMNEEFYAELYADITRRIHNANPGAIRTPEPKPLPKRNVDLSNELNRAVEEFLSKTDSEKQLQLAETKALSSVVGLMSSTRQAQDDAHTAKILHKQVKGTLQELRATGTLPEVAQCLERWSVRYAPPKAFPSEEGRPAWTRTTPLVFTQVGGTRRGKESDFALAYEAFKHSNLEETPHGFRAGNNHCRVYYNSDGQFFMSQFNEEMFEKIVQALAKTNSSVDITAIPQQHQLTAAKIVAENGLKIIGMSPEIREKHEQPANSPSKVF